MASLRGDLALSARHTPVPATLALSPSPSPAVLPTQPPTNSQIEAAIQKAQQMSTRATPDGLGRDTRMQLFVGNLPYRVRWQDLKDLFRKAGTVLRADVSLGPDNRSRGYGTVLYGNPDDASRAVEMFNGYSWQSRTLEVRPDRLPPDFDAGTGLSASISGSSTAAFNLGPSPLHAMPYIPPTAQSVEDPMPSPMGSMFTIGERPRVLSSSGRTLFVGNLPFHCQWQDLKDLFRQAGSVLRADVVLGPDGRSRGHGTVSFANDADAEIAVNMFNGYEFNGRPLKVHYDKYTGQNTPAAMIGTSASPAPPPLQLQSLQYTAYSSIPTYLTHAPGTIILPPSNATFDHMTSSPHSPYDPYPPAPQMQLLHRQGSTSTASASDLSPPRGSSSGQPQQTQTQQSPPPLHIETQLHTHAHPAHPGPITLPPPPTHGFPAPATLSPQSTQVPPITPSMPSFSFVPQAPTPPALHPQFLSPGLGPFSPTLSPGGFFSPGAAHPAHPFLNPAPGAPVHLQPVGVVLPHPHPHAHPHSPVSPHPPASPGAYFVYHHGPSNGEYFPPVGIAHHVGFAPNAHPHPLAQEHTPPDTSDVGDDAATISQRSMLEESVLRRPQPPLEPEPEREPAQSPSPASVVSVSEGSKPGTSSPGTSLDDLPAHPHPQKRSAADDRAIFNGTASAPQALYVDLPRSHSTGQHAYGASFSQIVRGGATERPSHAYSSSVAQLQDGLATLELGPTTSTANRDRRASWHVDSPSVEVPRGGSYFALGYAG